MDPLEVLSLRKNPYHTLSEPPAPVSPQAVIQLLCGRKGPQSPDQTKQTNKQTKAPEMDWTKLPEMDWNCLSLKDKIDLLLLHTISYRSTTDQDFSDWNWKLSNNFVIILYKYYYIPIHFFVWKRLSSIYSLWCLLYQYLAFFVLFHENAIKKFLHIIYKTLHYSQFSIKQAGWVKRAGWKTYLVRRAFLLKVSKSWKQNTKFSNTPKNQQKSVHFFALASKKWLKQKIKALDDLNY